MSKGPHRDMKRACPGRRRPGLRGRIQETHMTLRHMQTLVRRLALFCLCGTSAISFAAQCQNIAVPAYFYPSQPTSQWNTAVSDAPLPTTTARILILNPSNGPGKKLNQDYVNAVQTAHAAGSNFLVYGYIYTKY